MIQQARAFNPNISFRVGRAQDLDVPGRRDVISMLFHVINYQTTDDMVREAMEAVARHLSDAGVFVFDFWHTDAVLREPPVSRVRRTEVGGRPLFRISHPSENRSLHRVEVRFEFRWDSMSGELANEETHSLRHFGGPELEGFLEKAGMRALLCEGWMSHRPLAATDWHGLICASHRQ